jgi:hypothetical protein
MSLVAASSLGKRPRFLREPAQLNMQTFNGIGGLDDFSHLRGKTVKGDDLFPVSFPALSNRQDILYPKGRASN